MAFYSMLGGFKLKKYEKDYQKLIDTICDALLEKENIANELTNGSLSIAWYNHKQLKTYTKNTSTFKYR